jgi:hypothetical protein
MSSPSATAAVLGNLIKRKLCVFLFESIRTSISQKNTQHIHYKDQVANKVKEIKFVCCVNSSDRQVQRLGLNVVFVNGEVDGTYSYHCGLKG